MKRILILGVGLGVLVGCADRLPTDPGPAQGQRAEQVEPAGPASLSAATTDRADALGGVDDALDRIVPALTDRNAARPLEAALGGLRNALANANENGIPALIEAAHGAVDRYARTGHDEADLDAVRLALSHARGVLAPGS